MRRLTLILSLCLLCLACRSREKVRTEPTVEISALLSTVNTADPAAAIQLINGFHAIEQNSWRWTKRQFTVTLRTVPQSVLRLRATVPEAVTARIGAITLTASSSGRKIGSVTWQQAGDYTFAPAMPAEALRSETVTIDFTLDKYLPAGSVEIRELGVIVQSVGLEAR